MPSNKRINGGKAVVGLHSAFFDGSMFSELERHLAPCSIDAPTYRGQNGVRKDEQPITLQLLAEDFVAYIESTYRGVPLRFIGSSMGAFVGILAATARPELFDSLVLVGTTHQPEANPEGHEGLIKKLGCGRGGEVAPLIAGAMFGASTLTGQPELVDRWRAKFNNAGSEMIDTVIAIQSRPDMRAAFASIRAPVLVLTGTEDKIRPPRDSASMAVDRPGTLFSCIAGAGHTPIVEQPSLVARIILGWWRSMDTSG